MPHGVFTTLRKLREADACQERYVHLRNALGKNYGDDTPINLVKCLETNGLEDVLWILETALDGDNIDKRCRLFAVACCQDILHLMEDQRSIDAVRVAHLYAYGEANDSDRDAARDAAWAAAREAAWEAARAAARAAAWAATRAATRAAAWEAAWEAAREAARAATRARQAEHFRIIFSADFNI